MSVKRSPPHDDPEPIDDIKSNDAVLSRKRKRSRLNRTVSPADRYDDSADIPADTYDTTSTDSYITVTPVNLSSDSDFHLAKQRLEIEQSVLDKSWIKQYWRPGMGWVYMAICIADFIVFPALMIFLPVIFKAYGITVPYVAWKSLTLENGGIVHMAFGAILGVAAWTRGKEKLSGQL
jgi:hypothetical protein